MEQYEGPLEAPPEKPANKKAAKRMPEGNGSYDWRERMRKLEDAMERNWQEHERIERNIDKLRASMVDQKDNVDKLLGALRELIERIPPENLK